MSFILKDLRAKGARPRVHGNGFIQLDIDERQRLHIWGDPRIPRQKVATPIHDHVFGFRSTILVGRLVNITYSVVYEDFGDYQVFSPTVRQDEDTVLRATGLNVIAYPAHTDMISVNSRLRTYSIVPYDFHETVAPDGPAATIIVKDGPTQAQGAPRKPRVLVPHGASPDNEFNRYDADPELLWQIIEDTVG